MTKSVTTDIVQAVAEAKGTDATTVDFLLSDYVDCDALDTLMDSPTSSVTVSFDLPEHTVTVSSDETDPVEVQVEELESQAEISTSGV